MNHPDPLSESLETIFWVTILQFFDVDPGSGREKIWIRDKHLGSATLLHNKLRKCHYAYTVPVSSTEHLNTKSNEKYSQKMYNRANDRLQKYLVSEYIIKIYLKGSKDSSTQEATSP